MDKLLDLSATTLAKSDDVVGMVAKNVKHSAAYLAKSDDVIALSAKNVKPAPGR